MHENGTTCPVGVSPVLSHLLSHICICSLKNALLSWSREGYSGVDKDKW